MEKFIYADCAASAVPEKCAVEAMLPYMTELYGNPSQPYFFGERSKTALENARDEIAGIIGARTDEIFFTSGGTESDNLAIKGFCAKNENSRLFVSATEHKAVLNSALAEKNSGRANLNILPVNEKGLVDFRVLDRALSFEAENKKPTLVSVMLANNETGTIQDIPSLSRTAHCHGAYFHTDAVQALGHIGVNVNSLGADMLSASAHKFGGPRGTGFLYVKKGTPVSALMNGGTQEKSLRPGTENTAGAIGTAAALKKHVDSIETDTLRLISLENIITEKLNSAGIDYIRNGDKNGIPGNMSLSFRFQDGEALLHRLDLYGICVSTGSACDSVNTQVSHVLKAMGISEEYARGTVRISLGIHNTKEEAAIIADRLITIINEKTV